MSDTALPSPDNPAPAPSHRRRPRYAGKNPRRFEEKYKERDPQRYGETVAKVLASGKTPAGTHRPIMVAEILEALAPKPGELAVDCTFGYGGHAQEILARLQPGGRLIGLDADPIELPKTEARLRAAGFGPEMFMVVRSNFAGLPKVLAEIGARLWLQTQPQRAGNDERAAADALHTAALQADCVLADLGVSSMQLDDPARGFSTKGDGPLDMRMNPQRGFPASALLEKTSARRWQNCWSKMPMNRVPRNWPMRLRVALLPRPASWLTRSAPRCREWAKKMATLPCAACFKRCASR